MEPSYLFLDTEWADLEGSQLVSLALINADGTRHFYAERDPLPERPTDFVRESVYPLLDRGSAAKPDASFANELRVFLASFPNHLILYDYPNDDTLLRCAFAGFSASSVQADVNSTILRNDLVAMVLEDWFLANSSEAARRHHALVDANALRVAWLAANGLVEAPWSPFWVRHKSIAG